MSILTISSLSFVGNTLKAAAMELFSKSHQRDVVVKLVGGQTIVSIYDNGSWTDYDTWKDGVNFSFLLAA